ncbi:ATP-dependent Clp protease ATP-binding subunit, partial [Patescibacteria group bacterium]|nr:ATP-dependent Clp protease ATP-binding subunit [Patescibacteria group bacterium]
TVKRIIEKCILIAHLNEHKYVGTEHLLSALLASEDKQLIAFFDQKKELLADLREQIDQVLKSTTRFPEFSSTDQGLEELGEDMRVPPPRQTRASALESFAREITRPDLAELLDPVIGRAPELQRMTEILCRRTKNNPVLLGDPGVGKTAVVEGLAQLLVSGEVPDNLYGMRILSLDLALTVAGTMYRGEFEARLKQIVEEATNDPDVILFIDEIHNIVGAGSTTGSLDAANILKPALARGEIRCIGATTWDEYKKHIEPDAALDRRFQAVTIDQPNPDATLKMLLGLEKRYADHHQIHYEPEALKAAVELADRYLTDRLFPDKAIDLIDEAAASVVSRRKSRETMERVTALELAIQVAEDTKLLALDNENLEDADSAEQNVIRLEKERINLIKKSELENDQNRPMVTAKDIAQVVARMASVPLSTILASERQRLTHLEKNLRKHIIGQDQAIKDMAEVVRRSRLGLTDHNRPKSALLLVGPSGTGKTELSRALARELFGREDALIKLDMSEFSESHTVSKLVGSPAGYVGYRESTKLTDAIRKRPHCVVLFDEFEKSHQDVQNMLLQILEDGQMTDSTGRVISFRQSYVILTSNIGSDKLDRKNLGFAGADDQAFSQMVRDEIKTHFRPELLNRLDRTIVFNPLRKIHLKKILRKQLNEILERVNISQSVACTAGDDVLEWLLSQPLPAEEGARAVRRLLEREITSMIGRMLTEKPEIRKIRFKVGKEKLLAL